MEAALIIVVAAGVAGALAAYRFERRALYVLAKTVASAGFVALAVAVGAARSGWTGIALAGLALAAVGDVVLGLRGKRAFIAGMASFALAHAVLSAAFLVRGTEPRLLAALAIAVAVPAVLAWRAYHLRVPLRLRIAVAVYLAIVSTMAASGLASGVAHRMPLLGLGAVLVAASDVAVARERFGTPAFANKVFGLPSYYLGQTLIALALAA